MKTNNASELRRAEGLRRGGKADKALEILRSLASEDPRDVELRRKIADLLVETGNRDVAISQLVKLQEHLAAQGDLLGAISSGLRVVELDPKFENPLAYVAKVKLESLREEQKRLQAKTLPAQPILTPLNQITLLKDLGGDELASVAATMRRHEVGEGKTIFEEGAPGQSLYFLNRGLLEVRSGPNRLGLVSAGSCFGEFSFLTGEPRTATVRTLEASELLELSAESMRSTVKKYPRLRAVLFELYRERALTNVLSVSPLFEVIPSKDRARLAPRFKLVELPAGGQAFGEGERGGALFLVKSGMVEVRTTLHGELLVLARLGKHQFFGEVSFLTGVPRTATVHAVEPTELLKIEEAELRELVRHHPFLKDVLSRYHLDRVTATAESLKAFLKSERVEGIVS
ncbi:MAG: cyclic nucleotide-binding domain-containing protein [Vicinamibacteria bacterium]